MPRDSNPIDPDYDPETWRRDKLVGASLAAVSVAAVALVMWLVARAVVQ